MVYGGIHWSGVSVGGMGGSQGAIFSQQGPHIPLAAPVWFNGRSLGGRLGGWVVGGKVGEIMHHGP